MNIAGIILAGGKSRRMQQDKAELSWYGVSLIEKQFALLAGICGKDAVFISGQRPHFRHIADQECGLGPLEGLRSTLAWINAATTYLSVIVIAVDMPLLTAQKISQLIAPTLEYPAAVKFSGFNLPVRFNHLSEILTKIECLKTQAHTNMTIKYSFKELYRNLIVTELDSGATVDFVNINTPAEWQIALNLGS